MTFVLYHLWGNSSLTYREIAAFRHDRRSKKNVSKVLSYILSYSAKSGKTTDFQMSLGTYDNICSQIN